MARDFIDNRQSNWKRLEEMLDLAGRKQLRVLHREQVREFGRLYQRTAADFAVARQEIRDARLVNYLNNLVGRAHGAIYRTNVSGTRGFIDFYRYSIPALVRETWRYTLAAFLIFLLTGTVSGICAVRDNDYANRFFPGVVDQVKSKKNWTEAINSDNPAFSSMIFTNNARVALFSFVTGIFAGLGSLFFLAFNGVSIGGVTALCIKYKFTPILIFMAGHGVLELTAIFLAGGAGLLMGGALLVPGNQTRGAALLERGIKAVKLMAICIPMLALAGLIEGFVSPAHISHYFKFGVSLASAVLMAIYFATPDRRVTGAPSTTTI